MSICIFYFYHLFVSALKIDSFVRINAIDISPKIIEQKAKKSIAWKCRSPAWAKRFGETNRDTPKINKVSFLSIIFYYYICLISYLIIKKFEIRININFDK